MLKDLLPQNRNDWYGIITYFVLSLMDYRMALIILAVKESNDRAYTGGRIEYPDIIRGVITIISGTLVRYLICNRITD